MVGALLLRGMLVGLVAGILCFTFLKVFGEPAVERAIAFEAQRDQAKAHAEAHGSTGKGMAVPNEEREPELVSRDVQAGIGLFTGVMTYSAALGGLFALSFALVYGRMVDFGPRATSLLLGAVGFVAVYLVPNLKYPANPPSVGDSETIGMRTALYFGMIAISLAAIIAAGMLRVRLQPRYGAWNAVLIAGTAYLVIVTVLGLALPTVNEVPEQFPAVVLWEFRIASLGAQLVVWATLGLIFGVLTERAAITRRTKAARTIFAAFFPLLVLAAPASAASTAEPAPQAEPAGKPAQDGAEGKTLLGDLGGIRPFLAGYGATLGIQETSEILGNLTGGRRRGAVYEGLTDLTLSIDLQPYFRGEGTVFARAYQIHGRGLSANNIGNLATASGIEATRTTRLYELWYERPLADWLRLRIGQQAAGQEFMISSTAQLFVNATFGWPVLPAAALPSGGATYPLGTPGVRAHIDAGDGLNVLVGVLNGDPAGPGQGDPQLRDASGTAFRVNDGAFAIFETRYNPGNSERNGTYRLGGWLHTGRTLDPRLDSGGLSLANPASSGAPRRRHRNYSFYAILDQPILEESPGLTVFARAMGAPGDRNLVDFYVDAGIAYARPFGRPDDTVGIAFGHARIGGAARGLDADVARFTGQPYPIRTGESVLEITYRLQVAPWWQLQPNFQYIFNPGGGIENPSAPGGRVGDAAVLGLRTAITF